MQSNKDTSEDTIAEVIELRYLFSKEMINVANFRSVRTPLIDVFQHGTLDTVLVLNLKSWLENT